MKYFIITYTGKPYGESGESCSTKYAFNGACESCGTGASLVGYLKTNKLKKVKKSFFQTVDGDYLISDKLYLKFVERGVKIFELKKVVNYKGEELPFYHLDTELSLPKATVLSGLIIDGQCDKCKRNGYFNDVVIGDLENNRPTKVLPVNLIYRDFVFDLKPQSDIYNSWEHMGLSNRVVNENFVLRYARPLMIVSEFLKILLEEEGIGDLEFESIKIE